jgi:hypothetical protein
MDDQNWWDMYNAMNERNKKREEIKQYKIKIRMLIVFAVMVLTGIVVLALLK